MLDRKIAARGLRGPRHAPAAAEVRIQGVDKERLLLIGDIAERHRPDRPELPVVPQLELHAQQRTRKLIEDLPRHVLQKRELALTEEDVELQGPARWLLGALAQYLLHELVQVFEVEAVHRLAGEIAQG